MSIRAKQRRRESQTGEKVDSVRRHSTFSRRSIVSQVPNSEITEVIDPVGHVQVVYLGPVAPHWECRMVFGDEEQIQAFVDRIDARLRFLPPHDPQFRRNRERVNRDAERENLLVEWNLGYDEEA